MKLDPTLMGTMNSKVFRVLEVVEKGMKDQNLRSDISHRFDCQLLRHGGTDKNISSLLQDKLLNERMVLILANAGYGILVLHNIKSRGFVAALSLLFQTKSTLSGNSID